MVLEHAARALRIVGVQRLRHQRQADHVDAHAGDFLHGLLDGAAGARAAIRPERVADVLLHRRAARVGRIVGRLMPSLETEPVAAADREHRAVLGDAPGRIHAPHRARGADGEGHRGAGRAQRGIAVVERRGGGRVAARRNARAR